MLSAERHSGFCSAPARYGVVTNHFKQALAAVPAGERWNMNGFDCARDRLVHQFPSAFDSSEAPSGESQ